MLCPSDIGRGNRFQGSGGNWARGNYGYNAFQFWPNSGLWKTFFTDPLLQPLYNYNIGMGGFDNGVDRQVLNFSKITDGSTHTIMLAEMRVGLSPRDRRGVWAMGMCGSNMHCRHAGYAINDCGGYNDDIYKSADILADVGLRPLLTECMGLDTNVDASGQSTVRSRHPGGERRHGRCQRPLSRRFYRSGGNHDWSYDRENSDRSDRSDSVVSDVAAFESVSGRQRD